MKNLRKTSTARNRELGSVAILIAFMWTTLFGMAVVAVDFGYLYTKRRSIQAAADAAITAGMPRMVANDSAGAIARANQIANLNGFTGGDIVGNTATASGSQLTITLQHTYPTFFGSVLGMTPKTIKAKSVGKLATSTSAAIYAGDTNCAAGQWASDGLEVTGGGLLKVNGDVQSNSKVHVGPLSALCNPASTCMVTGSVKTSCAATEIFNDVPATFGMPTQQGAATVTDPLAGHNLAWFEPKCTLGSSTTTSFMGPWPWIAGPCVGGNSLPPNTVICSNTLINVNPPAGSLCASTAAFISADVVNITTSGSVTLTGPASTDGIIAYSDFSGGGPAILLTNGVTTLYTLNGSIYAPNGLISAQSGNPGLNMTGVLDGFKIFLSMGPNQPWTFSSPTGGAGGPWHLDQ
jgi:hypothetical protein